MTRTRAGVGTVLNHCYSIYEDVLDAGWVLVRLSKSRPFADGFGVEDDEIGFHANGEPATVTKAEAVGGHRGHLADGGGQVKDAALADVITEEAGIGAIR